MSDIRDVMDRMRDAESARNTLVMHYEQLPDGPASDVAVTVGLAAIAVCAEIAALTTRLDYLVSARWPA